jgi:hypothetical protein
MVLTIEENKKMRKNCKSIYKIKRSKHMKMQDDKRDYWSGV